MTYQAHENESDEFTLPSREGPDEEAWPGSLEGFTRPEMVVLEASSVVPDKNLIVPPPNQFTHELARHETFYYNNVQQETPSSGHFPKGTRVVLLRYEGGRYCHVADAQGLYVVIEYDSLRPV